MSKEIENPFDYTGIEEASPEDTQDTSDASVSEEETKQTEEVKVEEPKQVEEKQPETDNAFDYSDLMTKPEEDLSDEDSESEDDASENNSASADKDDTEKNSSSQKSEPSQEQLYKAAQLGIAFEDIRGLSERELSTAIRIAEKVKPAEKPQEEKQEQDEEKKLFKPIELNMDEFDEDTVALMKSMQDQFNENMQAMADQLEQSKSAQLQQQELAAQQGQAQFFEWFDKTVSDLGEGWVDVFGDDPEKLSRTSDEVQNRIKLIEEMDRLAVSHPELDKQGLFDTAMRIQFSKELTTKETQRKKKAKDEHRQTRTTARPTSRNRSIENMPDGRDKALATLKSMAKKKKFLGIFG